MPVASEGLRPLGVERLGPLAQQADVQIEALGHVAVTASALIDQAGGLGLKCCRRSMVRAEALLVG